MYNGRIFGTTETFSSTTDFFGKSCLTMMMSVTECFICIDSLAFPQKGDAASEIQENFVSQMIQKIALNQNRTN